MDKYIHKSTIKIIFLFVTWRAILVAFLIFALNNIPVQFSDKFFGGGFKNYSIAPEVFSWANFDGEHYLSISIFGYKGLEQAFFPIYPILINFFASPFYNLLGQLLSSTLTGLFISNISFFFALIFLWELLRIDYSEKLSFRTLILMVVFPTSFYFGSLYNESFFLLLAILSFLSVRKGKWWLAGILGGIASATRIFGILLLPAFLIEVYQQKANFKKAVWIFAIPLGLGIYMFYQYLTVGDPLTFYHLQKIVGEQHQSGFTLLPQVYFRYIKMLLTVDRQNLIYQTIILELIIGITFFLLPIYGYFRKIRLSYLFFAMVGFLLPTIQGSFSSVPRYVLVFFPSFIALALWMERLPKIVRVVLLTALFSGLAFETVLFLRGYWVA